MADDDSDAMPLPVPATGHNGGPPLEEHEVGATPRRLLWQQAHRRAWKTPPREVLLRRLARAEELGMSYREYTLEILERGRYL
ncbi:hypothetical protein [Roseomonas elaeocarpi]|uniref:Uncharacterized protein n=1 Tax=Roseomonas elaeocarpi TaxID=907779 RepID=A0ABV6JVW7_9PROT